MVIMFCIRNPVFVWCFANEQGKKLFVDIPREINLIYIRSTPSSFHNRNHINFREFRNTINLYVKGANKQILCNCYWNNNRRIERHKRLSRRIPLSKGLTITQSRSSASLQQKLKTHIDDSKISTPSDYCNSYRKRRNHSAFEKKKGKEEEETHTRITSGVDQGTWSPPPKKFVTDSKNWLILPSIFV